MLTIPFIGQLNTEDLQQASQLLEQTQTEAIACNNWKQKFPYAPEVRFRIAHNHRELFLRFDVTEQYTMAKITQDNGEVWTDSCVEFFIAPDERGYYNFEFTCIGKALLGFRKERPNPTHAAQEILNSIKRYSSLGNKNFDEKEGNNRWQLTVAIPVTALFLHRFDNWEEVTATANFYKCGDRLSHPHFLSWKPIDTPTPDFHIARCFSEIQFEEENHEG